VYVPAANDAGFTFTGSKSGVVGVTPAPSGATESQFSPEFVVADAVYVSVPPPVFRTGILWVRIGWEPWEAEKFRFCVGTERTGLLRASTVRETEKTCDAGLAAGALMLMVP
jgi:hypothetical protein